MVKIKDFTIGFKKLGGGARAPQFLYNFLPWPQANAPFSNEYSYNEMRWISATVYL